MAQNLVAHYLERQRRYIARLYARCIESSAVRSAIYHLDRGGLLREDEVTRLPGLIGAHDNGASDQQARRRAYISWREHAVETQRSNSRALSRLVFDAERVAYELDFECLFFCRGCRQVVVPRNLELTSTTPPECSFCNLRAQTSLAEAAGESLVRPDEDGFWAVCQPPVPAWVTEEAERPLSQSIDPHEEW